MFPQNKNVIMKQEEIKIRVSSKLKNDFQHICEFEETTMSNKINTFIVSEVKDKNSILTTTKKLVKLDVILLVLNVLLFLSCLKTSYILALPLNSTKSIFIICIF